MERAPLWAARVARAVLGVALGIGAAVLASSAAFGAGTGYGGGTGGGGTGGTGGVAGTVVSTTTIQPTGGSGSGVVGSSTINVTVPPSAFNGPVQLVITDATSSSPGSVSGNSVVVSFGIAFYENGSKVTGTFPAVSASVSGPNITASSVLYLNGSTTPYPSTFSPPHTLNFTVTSDPNFLVAQAATAAALSQSSTGSIAGGTTAQTGEPFLGEGLVAGVLVLCGGLVLVGLRLRRRTA